LAVIKQQRTTFASPIGVVRANTGSGAVFRSVNKIADQMIQNSFANAKANAIEAGEDLARSKEIGSLRSINPETNEIEMMTNLAAPASFGTVAQKAYKRAIESRYVSQIETDFKLKAKELYITHKDDPNGVTLFSDSFAQFIDSSIEHVDPNFKQVVSAVGASLLASNKINFMEQQAKTVRANILTDFDSHFTESVSDIATLWASDDPKAVTDAKAGELRLLQRIQDLAISDPSGMTRAMSNSYRTEIFKARTSGVISRVAALVQGSEELKASNINDFRTVLEANGVGLDKLPVPLQNIAQQILTAESVKFVKDADGDYTEARNIFYEIKDFADTELASLQSRLINEENAKAAVATEQERDQKEKDLIFRAETEAGLVPRREAADRKIIVELANGDIDGAISAFEAHSRETLALADPSLGDAAINRVTALNSVARSRSELLKGLSTFVASGLNSKQTSEFAEYIDSSGQFGSVPNELKSVADKIIETMDVAVDKDILRRHIDRHAVKKGQIEAANATSNAKVKAGNEVANGRGLSTDTKHTEVVDEAIINTIGQGNDRFFLTQESVSTRDQWGQIVRRTNVLPDSLQNYMKVMFSGSNNLPPKVQEILMMHYDQFSRVLSTDGSKAATNMWHKSKLSSEENGFFEAVLSVAKFRGYDDLPTIMDDIRAQHGDKATQGAKIAAMFPDGLNQFLAEATTDNYAFASNTVNPNIAKDLLPYIEYLVAGNASKKQIEETTQAFFKNLYPKTEGVVQDFDFGNVNRSRQALSAIFPNKDDRHQVVKFLNRLVAEDYLTPDKKFYLTKYDSTLVEGEGFIDLPPQNRLVLMPLQGAGMPTDEMRYMVIERRIDGTMAPFIAAKRSTDPRQPNPRHQVIVDVKQLKAAVDTPPPPPVDSKLLQQLATQRASGYTSASGSMKNKFTDKAKKNIARQQEMLKQMTNK